MGKKKFKARRNDASEEKSESPKSKQASKTQIGENTLVKVFFYVSFVAALIMSIKYCFVGIDNYILGRHAFRQTQTALSAFYTIKEGFQLDYLTPVLGDPWKIILEFPLYQWVVVLMKQMSPFSLDLSGRIVSLLFFYLTLIPCYKIINKYTKNRAQSLFGLSFILLHPTYIFWSRSFMIESTALFLSAMYLWQSLEYFDKKRIINLVLAVLFVLMGALVKITTLIPFIAFMGIFILAVLIKNRGYDSVKKLLPYAIWGLLLLLLPIITIKLWLNYSDSFKHLDEYTFDVVFSQLDSWNFGTIAQRLSLKVWKDILSNSQLFNPSFYLFIIAALIFAFYKKLKYRMHALVCLGLYFSAPMIFTNLHLIHDYYTYANSAFFCISLAYLALSLITDGNEYIRYSGMVFSIITLGFLFSSYYDSYYPQQKDNNDSIVKISNIVKDITKEDEAIFVYGNDWGSEYAYYTERKTIALKNIFHHYDDKMFQYILNKHKNYKLRTIVLVTYFGMFDGNFMNEIVNKMGFKPVLQQEPFFIFQIPDAVNTTPAKN